MRITARLGWSVLVCMLAAGSMSCASGPGAPSSGTVTTPAATAAANPPVDNGRGTHTFTSAQYAPGPNGIVDGPQMHLSGGYLATYDVRGTPKTDIAGNPLPGCQVSLQIWAVQNGIAVQGVAGKNVSPTGAEATGTFGPVDPAYGKPVPFPNGVYIMRFTDDTCDSWTVTLAPV